MRIGVNCFLLQESMGGLRQYFLRLFSELLANESKHSYVFFYHEHNIKELDRLHNELWRRDAILVRDQAEVLRHLDKIDLYFCPFGAIWPRPVQKPSVVTLVDIQEKYYPQFFTKEDLWNRAYHFKPSTKAADRVLTISEFSKDSIAKFHGISKDKISVAYLAADEGFYSKDITKTKIASSLPDNFVFYPANRWLHKNHDNLLKALLIIKKEKGLRVNVVFTGFDFQTGYPLEQKVEEYGLKEQVFVIGYVSADELRYIYKKAAMLCFPSLFEGFGMPLVEAMAAGCPVVCSNTTSMPEVAGGAALLFDPTDPQDIAKKIFLLYNDWELREKFIALGRSQAGHFSIKETARVHLEVFELAVGSYSTARYLYQKYLREPLHKFSMYSGSMR